MIKRILLLYILTTLTSCAATGRMTVTNINIINIPSQPVYAPISANYLLHGVGTAALTNSLVLTPGANISFQTNSGLLYIVGQAGGTNGGSSYTFGPQFTTNGGVVYIAADAVVTNKDFFVSGTLNMTNNLFSTIPVNIRPLWTNASTTYYGIYMNVSNSLSSSAASRLIDLNVNDQSKFSVDKDGYVRSPYSVVTYDMNANRTYGNQIIASNFIYNYGYLTVKGVINLNNASKITDSGDGDIIMSDSTGTTFSKLYFSSATGKPYLAVSGKGLFLSTLGASTNDTLFRVNGNLYAINQNSDIFWSSVGTSKGDIKIYTGSYWTNLSVGSAGQVLSVDSTTDSGVKWTTPVTAPTLNSSQFSTSAVVTIKDGVMLTNINLYGYLDTQLTPERAAYIDVDGRLASSALIDTTELEQLNGVTANIQAQLNLKQTGSQELTNWSQVSTGAVVYTNIMSSKGDILVHNGTNLVAFARGADGQFLVADSSSSNGLKYITVSGGTTNTYNADQFVLSGAELNIKNGVLLTNAVVATSLKTPVSASKAVVTDANGYLTNINTTATQIGYLSNVTSDVQAQLNTKQYGTANGTNWSQLTTNVLDSFLLKSTLTAKGDLITSLGSIPTRQAVGTNGQILAANTASLTGLEWITPTTSGSSTFNTTQFDSSGGATNIKSGALVTNLNIYGSSAKFNNLTANRVLVLDASQQVAASSIDNTHLNYLANVTSDIQNQFSGKIDTSTLTLKGQLITFLSGSPVSLDPGTDGYVLRSWSAATKGLDWVPLRTYSMNANQFSSSTGTTDTYRWIKDGALVTNMNFYGSTVYGYVDSADDYVAYFDNGKLTNAGTVTYSKLLNIQNTTSDVQDQLNSKPDTNDFNSTQFTINTSTVTIKSGVTVTNLAQQGQSLLPSVSTGERVKVFGTTNSTHVGTLFQEQSDSVPYFGLSQDDLAGSSGMFLYKNLNMHQPGLTWERVLGVDELGTVVSTALTTGNASVLQNGWALIPTNALPSMSFTNHIVWTNQMSWTNFITTNLTTGWNYLPTNILSSIGGTSAASGTNAIQLYVQQARPGTNANTALLDQSQSRSRLVFNNSTVQEAVWQIGLPVNYDSQPVIKIHYTSSSDENSKNFVFKMYVDAFTDGDSANVFAETWSSANSVTANCAATAGYVKTATISLSNADNMTAGDFVSLKLTEDGGTSDGNAQVLSVVFEYKTK